MSVQSTGQVWQLDIPGNEKLVLLAYTDHASPDGTGIWPAVPLIARKTRYSEREVQRITRSLERQGILVPDGSGPRGTNRWRFAVGDANGQCAAPATAIPAPPTADTGKPEGVTAASPVTSTARAGVIGLPEGVTLTSPVTSTGVTAATPGGDTRREQGVTPMSPEPSLIIHEPSSRAALSQIEYQQANAKVNAILEGASRTTYLNRDKIPEPFLAFADTYHELTGQEPTKRVIQDWLMTFSEWQSDGVQPDHVRRALQDAEGHFTVTRPGSLTSTAVALRARTRISKPQRNDDVERTRLETQRMDEQNKRAVPPPEHISRHVKDLLKSKTLGRER